MFEKLVEIILNYVEIKKENIKPKSSVWEV